MGKEGDILSTQSKFYNYKINIFKKLRFDNKRKTVCEFVMRQFSFCVITVLLQSVL
jgi:hypothetical protein